MRCCLLLYGVLLADLLAQKEQTKEPAKEEAKDAPPKGEVLKFDLRREQNLSGMMRDYSVYIPKQYTGATNRRVCMWNQTASNSKPRRPIA